MSRILKLSQEDLFQLGLFKDISMTIDQVRRALLYHNQDVYSSDKLSIVPDYNRKLNSLNCIGKSFASVKIVGANINNSHDGKPRSNSIIMIYDKDSLELLSIMNGTDISNLRTGACAAIVNNLLGYDKKYSVAIVGSGKIAEATILCLNESSNENLEKIILYGRTQSKVDRILEWTSNLRVDVVGYNTIDCIADANYVIAATSAVGSDLFDYPLLKEDVVTLELGHGLGRNHIIRAINAKNVYCDSWPHIKARNSQMLPRLYNESDKDLRYFIENNLNSVADLIFNNGSIKMNGEPYHFTFVGLPELDYEVATKFYTLALKNNVGMNIKF